MAKHETPARSDEWYTPAYVFDALNTRFDLDVAYPAHANPEVPANHFLCSNSLETKWRGFVWMNPPFGRRNGLAPWLNKFFEHNNGVALVPDRTSAPWWQQYAPQAWAILFAAPKIHFIPGPGVTASSPAQGTCLLAAGHAGMNALCSARDRGLGVLFYPWRST